ncbi:MAG: MucBP domain-containing protein, partial [Clostridia bacterium]|nr:MucBP domain-containing protein [Clostridia bacterium]
SHEVTEQDILAGSVKNAATATGADPESEEPEVKPDDTEDAMDKKNAHLTVTKSTTSEPENGESYALGETITYSITIKNDGNVTIKDITVTDTITGYTAETLTPDKTTLAPGEETTVAYLHEVNEQDILAGSVKNAATATGADPEGDDPDATPDDTDDVTEDVEVDLALTKEITNLHEDGTPFALDEAIEYRLVVTNGSNVVLYNVQVTDQLTGLSETVAELKAGESATYTASYTVTLDDITAFKVANTATVKADDVIMPKGETITPEAEASVETPVSQKYTLTIIYVYMDGTTAAKTYTEEIAYGDSYSVESPSIAGYTPDTAVVAGTMPTEDVTIKVIYAADAFNPITSVGLGMINVNVGESIE